MRKVAVVLTCVFSLMILASCAPKETSDAGAMVYKINNSYDYLTAFLRDGEGKPVRTDRTAGSAGEKEAADYIQSVFEGLGLEVSRQTFDIPKQKDSQNIIGIKQGNHPDPDKKYKVIIGAHYDNSYDMENVEGKAEGAYDNGSGVAVLLAVADYVSRSGPYPFDVEFVAFGAEELRMLGSKHYVGKMNHKDKEATLLMINLDSIGGGDYLYMYADEVKTLYEDLFHDVAKQLNAPLNRPPANKKVYYINNEITPYTHFGLASDNLSFMEAGINTVCFFSLNWSTNLKTGMVESETKHAVMHTKYDTIETLQNLYGDSFKEKMDIAASVIVETLENDNFMTTMQQAYAQKYDYSLLINPMLYTLIKAVLLVAIYAFIRLVSANFDKKFPVIIKAEGTAQQDEVFEGYENKGGASGGGSNPFEGF